MMKMRRPLLTTGELRILTLLATGHQPKQIAPIINLSYSTVKYYVRVIKAKLGTETITEAVAVAVARHLVTPFEE